MKNKVIDKFFYLNAWTVGYRKLENENEELPSRDKKAKYDLIPINDHIYYADPFVFEDGDDTYLFVESMNRYRGIATISVSKYQNGRFGKFIEIIKEPFHMSYPNVFKYGENYYMIPETSGSGQVRLYVATEFPYQWELCKVLLENGNAYTDNTIEFMDDNVFFYAFYESKGERFTELYQLDFDNYELIRKESEKTIINDRPAGNIICINEKKYRPLQDCDLYYGKAIKIYSHNQDQDEKLIEYINEDCYDVKAKILTGTHTLNRSKHFEVIDVKYDRFCLTRRWIWLVKKVGNHKDRK